MNWTYIVTLLFILTSIYYSVHGISIYKDDKKSKLRKIYIVNAVLLAVWSLSYGMMTIAADHNAGRMFWNIGFFSFCVFLPSWLYFLTHLASYNSKNFKKIVFFICLALAAAAVFCIVSGDMALVKTNSGYRFLYTNSLVFIIAAIFIIINFILMLFVHIRWMMNVKYLQYRKYALRFFILTTIVGLPALFFDVFIPLFSVRPVPALACMFILIISTQLGSVMKAHRILNVTVHDIAEDMFSFVSQPILALNADNRVILANKAAEKFWAHEITGINMAQLIKVNGSPPGQSFFDESFNMDDGITVLSGKELKYCSMLLSVVRDKYNDILNKIIIINDITELQKAAFREQEANKAKSLFLSRMSHEIRAPMNAIIGMAELALREDEAASINEYINQVKQSGNILLSIINDILDFSKIESGMLEIVPAEYSVASLMNDVINIIRVRVLNTKIRFTVNIDSNIPEKLYGDETRIRQILINLLGNAVKYTKEGFVSLFVFCNRKGKNAIELFILVSDSGIGIKEEDIKNLFKDFSRFDAEKNKGIEGVGLGLAITHHIVNAMGGDISVQSEYGKGSTFKVTLPQECHSYKPLALVNKPKEIFALIYERRDVNAKSILFTVDNLGLNYTLVSGDDELRKKMEEESFNYLFISYELYKRNRSIIKELAGRIEIVILSDFGEIIKEPELNAISMPVYCLPIANILNGVTDRYLYNNSKEQITDFTAPDAAVLIVDDMSVNLKVAEGLLLPYELQVDTCSSGMEAIHAVKQKHYDMVFMDHRMPGMDGIETVKHIREWEKIEKEKRKEIKEESEALSFHSSFSPIPIIALTADAIIGINEIFLENGFNGYLSKPIETDKLHAILEKWIPEHHKVKKN